MDQKYFDEQSAANFQQLQKEAKKIGFNFAAAKIDSISHRVSRAGTAEEMNFKVFISDGKKKCILSGKQNYKVSFSYRIMEPLQLAAVKR